MEISHQIKLLSLELFDEILQIRRHLHQYPELSFNETGTSKFIKTTLREWEIPFIDGFATNGILGIIEGNKKGGNQRCIALRADMDALPIQESTELSFQSKNKGVMHACGHDVHTASLLGTAKILNQLRDQFSGKVLLVFQPAEELIPGGAKQMLQDGVFKDHKPDVIIGQHVYPSLPAGTIGLKPGMYMASSDEIYIDIKGKGGHAAIPHKINDTVLAASQVIVSLQQVASRLAPTGIPTVLSFGKVVADGANNVIPDQVRIEGTFRTMDEEWRSIAKQKIKSIAESTARAMGVKAEVLIKDGYPFLVNNPDLSKQIKKHAQVYLGKEQVKDLEIRMTAEDFAWFTQEYQACFYRLGTAIPGKEDDTNLHSSSFYVDENAIKTGMGTMAWLAYSWMEIGSKE